AGGKLILWHGWADPHISARTTIAYHEALQKTMGKNVLNEFERLYLLPGVYHCGNGEGPSAIDLVTPMLHEDVSKPCQCVGERRVHEMGIACDWREDTSTVVIIAQTAEVSSSTSGSVASTVTRPVYPYPAVAKYKGTGDVNDAANFEKGNALYTKTTRSWLGEDFFKPYSPTEA
ncbi:Hypothetical protein PHPALM_5817, partial [Phytophthora palmivora]